MRAVRPCSAPVRSFHTRSQAMRPSSVRRADKPAAASAAGSAPPKRVPPQLRPKPNLEEYEAINAAVHPYHEASRETVASLEGIPEYELGRRAFIARPSKSATQAGHAKTGGWELTYQHEDRWENPLMGWTSTRDPYTNLSLRFDTLEEAIAYAKGHDLRYQVEDGGGFNPQNIKPKSYGEKFMYKPPRKGLTD